MKAILISWAYAIWLVGIAVVFYLVKGSDIGALEYAVLLGMLPAVAQMVLLGFETLGMARPVKFFMIFLLIVTISYLVNRTDWTAVTYIVELIYVTAIAALVAAYPEALLFRRIAGIYSVLAAVFIVYIDFTGTYTWGRLTAGIESNSWGLTAVSVGTAAFALRSRLLTAACLAAAWFTCYEASSRGSMLGLALAMVVVAAMTMPRLTRVRLLTLLGTVTVVLLCILIFAPSLWAAAQHWMDAVLEVNDPRRGLDSGFTGRDILWRAALDLWWHNPLFGVGYRQHEAYLPLNYSAHNAYLAMLADTGVFGFIWYLWLLIASGLAAFRIRDPRSRNAAVGLIVSYAVIGLFERRAINGANPLSLLFLMGCFLAMKSQEVRRWRPRLGAARALPAALPAE
jgi:O-antigen ligase